jgi:HAD superfamily hydrolase (TIGR01509 family)
VLERFGRSGEPGLQEHLVERRAKLYMEAQRTRSTVHPQSADCVRQIAARVPVAIASGAARIEIEGVLESSGLRELFPVLVCLEDVQRGKPDPQGYLMARDALAARIGSPLPADQVLVFEDSEQGLRAALAAGMQCIVIEGTAQAERLTGAAGIVRALDWSIPLIRERLGED